MDEEIGKLSKHFKKSNFSIRSCLIRSGITAYEVLDILEMKEKGLSFMEMQPSSCPSTSSSEKSVKGYDFYDGDVNGKKKNQDRSLIIDDFEDSCGLYGCFDGHGEKGHEVSQFLIDNIPNCIKQTREKYKSVKKYLTKGFLLCNKKLRKNGHKKIKNVILKNKYSSSGSTGIVCYIKNKKIYSCNVGDSRAILVQKNNDDGMRILPLSRDHTPERPNEEKRILDNGGDVRKSKGLTGKRVYLSGESMPGLAVTRAFGDFGVSDIGVIASPEIITHTISDNDKMLILASDGVWEFISNDEVIDLISNCETPEECSKTIVRESKKRWKNDSEKYRDDITCVTVFLS